MVEKLLNSDDLILKVKYYDCNLDRINKNIWRKCE